MGKKELGCWRSCKIEWEQDERVELSKQGWWWLEGGRQEGRPRLLQQTKTFPLNGLFPVISAGSKYWLHGAGAALCG